MNNNEEGRSRYFMRWSYMGFETGSNIYIESQDLKGAIGEGMKLIESIGSGFYYYLNVYRDKKFIGRITKDGYTSVD